MMFGGSRNPASTIAATEDGSIRMDSIKKPDVFYGISHPINQNDFDKRYGFKSDKKTYSVSCQTNSMINVYGGTNGVPQRTLDRAVDKWKENNYIYSDGSPRELNEMSAILAEEQGLTKYHTLIWENNDFKHMSEEEFLKSDYTCGILKKIGKKVGDQHFLVVIKNSDGTLTILDSNPDVELNYEFDYIMPMKELPLPNKTE